MKYKPSNGTEGMYFLEKFCCLCQRENLKNINCDILTRTTVYNIDDREYPEEWIYQNGKPICTAFED
jgi:hypothetical protein